MKKLLIITILSSAPFFYNCTNPSIVKNSPLPDPTSTNLNEFDEAPEDVQSNQNSKPSPVPTVKITPEVTPVPTPTSTITPTVIPTFTPTPINNNSNTPSTSVPVTTPTPTPLFPEFNINTIEEIYDDIPNSENCYTGILKKDFKLQAIDYINKIRKLHKLNPIEIDYESDEITANAALIMAANSTITHVPDYRSPCWTMSGHEGSATSNLFLANHIGNRKVESFQEIISILMKDNDTTIGHRRWFIDPFLKHISVGRVDMKPVVENEFDLSTGVAFKVVYPEKQDISNLDIDFVAYPYENYPKYLFSKEFYMSFSVISDKTNYSNNIDVDFSNANIEIKDENDNLMNVTLIQHLNNYQGIPNVIQWKSNTIQENKKYYVSINNILVSGHLKNYNYWFLLN